MKPRLCLPSTYVITADGPVDAAWWHRFQQVLDRGHRLVQLRLKTLTEAQQRPVVARAADLARIAQCRLLLNCSQECGSPDWVHEFGLAGLHLTTAKLMAMTGRPLPASFLVGASCHNIGELQKAEHIGADFACLAPVHSTPTHPGNPPLGLETFREWLEHCPLPVYALGGMGLADLDAEIQIVRRAGGQGIAGISAFWR